jgi:hypothetical protein
MGLSLSRMEARWGWRNSDVLAPTFTSRVAATAAAAVAELARTSARCMVVCVLIYRCQASWSCCIQQQNIIAGSSH